jgi:hypothetical protein
MLIMLVADVDSLVPMKAHLGTTIASHLGEIQNPRLAIAAHVKNGATITALSL